ncbi:MAG: hypothetical protein OHK93_002634 [Ramalina farinacea]|uniref:C3H1-type domain-containing protein n=1 Tax=Ramalina farinacea TaxID=258253 RepID=A0AA43QRU0_9LECA|nr:hypothetical protein [Ramalina farinacea]
MCRDFLQTGTCPAGDSCDLSHDPTPERVPACLHFLRGKCSNSPCRYAHVRVNPAALVCRDFAILGYCGKGVNCLERHIHECPDYANTGTCRNTKCALPHVDRAGQIRKRAAAASTANNNVVIDRETQHDDEEDDDDVVSDEEEDTNSDDMDSDGVEEILGADPSDDAASHALSQQQDFVGF